MTVLSEGLNCAIWLSRPGLVVTMIMILRIDLRFAVGMSIVFKKVVHPVRLGDAQEEQEKSSKANSRAARDRRNSSRRRSHGFLTSIGDCLFDQPERREIESAAAGGTRTKSRGQKKQRRQSIRWSPPKIELDRSVD